MVYAASASAEALWDILRRLRNSHADFGAPLSRAKEDMPADIKHFDSLSWRALYAMLHDNTHQQLLLLPRNAALCSHYR